MSSVPCVPVHGVPTRLLGLLRPSDVAACGRLFLAKCHVRQWRRPVPQTLVLALRATYQVSGPTRATGRTISTGVWGSRALGRKLSGVGFEVGSPSWDMEDVAQEAMELQRGAVQSCAITGTAA